jgi:hypothetical protein
MKSWVRFVGIIALFVATSTTNAAGNYVVRDTPLPPSSVAFDDTRPANELKGGLPLMFDPTYSIPDKRFTPSLLALLGHELELALGDRIKGKTIVVQRLQVQNYFRKTYQKNQSESLQVSANASGATLVAIQQKNPIDAMIFRLKGEVDGHPFEVELAKPFDASGPNGLGMVYNNAGSRQATKEIVLAGIAASVAEIAKALDGTTNADSPPAKP